MGETVIGGNPNRRLQVKAARGSREAKPKRREFTKARRAEFLAHFAATCNAKGSARAVGVSHSTVYAHRRSDERFRLAWEEALDQGYARLEAQLVREASEPIAVEADEAAAEAAARQIDAKTALAILEAYRRNRGARPGDILPRHSDAEVARARLEQLMIRHGMIEDEAAGEPA